MLVLVAAFDVLPPPPSATAEWLLPLLIVAVLVVVATVSHRMGWNTVFGDIVLIALGLALDAVALADFLAESHGSRRLWQPWLFLWLGWQVIAVFALVRHLRERPVAASPDP